MVVASTHLHVEIDRIEAGGKERERVRASRIAGARQRTKGPPLAPRTRDASRTPLSLSPQHPPLVFEASENTMTRPPKSPPSVETGPLSSRAPPKRHPREKASRPLTIDERFRAERQKESARDRQCQGLNYSRPRRKDESRDPPSTGPPFVLPYTPHKHHTLALSLTLSTLPPLASRRRPDRNAVRPAPRIIRSKYTDPQSDVARAARLGRHLRSRYRCSMCSAVRMD